MTNLDSILKRRTIISLTNAHIVKAMVFPLVMYGCESWIIEKAVQFSSVQFSCSLVSDSLSPMNRSTPGLPVHHQLPEFIQPHVH